MKGNINQISFRKRNVPIPADYRPLYKIGHLILILATSCRSNKASLMKLHFLSWAIKNSRNISRVRTWMADNFQSEIYLWGVEPTVNRAILYGIGEGLIEEANGDYQLLENGLKLYKAIRKDKDLFKEEKNFLDSLGKNGITEAKIKELVEKFL